MSNGGEVCCILQVCCPPARAEAALAKEIRDGAELVGDAGQLTPESAAAFILSRFDLAPKGLLQPLLKTVGDLAKAHPHE